MRPAAPAAGFSTLRTRSPAWKSSTTTTSCCGLKVAGKVQDWQALVPDDAVNANALREGLAYYNTLKARGVDARLLWFADENHWVLKPRNSLLWYAEFLAWLAKHTIPVPKTRH